MSTTTGNDPRVRRYIWDTRFLEMARVMSTFSKDPSTKVGAVLVNDQRIVVGMGYNGFPRGVEDRPDRLANRELKYKLVVHAEMNAILQAGPAAKGATLYVHPAFVMPPICHDCCKHAIQMGVKEVVGWESVPDEDRTRRWAESIALSRVMCEEAGVTWRSVNPNPKSHAQWIQANRSECDQCLVGHSDGPCTRCPHCNVFVEFAHLQEPCCGRL